MITTIVFDLGNVLLSFRPGEFLKDNGWSEPHKDLIMKDIFQSQEWIMLDNGDISVKEAISSISGKSSLPTEEIKSVFNLRTRIMFPLDENVKVVPALKKRGFKLYFLSNFPDDIFDEVRSGYSFFENFEGGLISARVKASKPGEKIFRILLDQYSLIAKECLFIDDSEANINTARRIGMETLLLNRNDDLESLLSGILGPAKN